MSSEEKIALILVIPLVALVGYVVFCVGRIIWAIFFPVKLPQDFDERLENIDREIAGLSIEEAKKSAELFLANLKSCIVKKSSTSYISSNLVPILRDFFSEVEEFQAGDEWLLRTELGPYEHDPTFIRLGQDGEHTHLCSKPGQDTVYIVADDVPKEQQIENSYPSVYHWLLSIQKRDQLFSESE